MFSVSGTHNPRFPWGTGGAYPFVFEAAPYAFYKDVVSPAPFTIHAYGDVMLAELPAKEWLDYASP